MMNWCRMKLRRKRCSKAVRNHSALSLANIENLHHVANLKKITIIPNAFSGRRCAVASFGEVDGKRWQSNDRGSMSNPLPGIHAHTNPSIPQHRQKIRKRSRDNYVMPRWWLPQVQTLRRGKTGFGRWRWRFLFFVFWRISTATNVIQHPCVT